MQKQRYGFYHKKDIFDISAARKREKERET